MNEPKKILIAEDELTNSVLLKRILTKAGYNSVVAHNGMDAFKILEKEKFDALLTDWMMPIMDGIELIRKTRESIRPTPLIIMITALVSEGARAYALESGADDYIAKPIEVNDLLNRISDGLKKKSQPAPTAEITANVSGNAAVPPFVGVGIAASTGGPPTIIEILKNISPDLNAAYFVVQHGPTWMLETFAQRLQKEVKLQVKIVESGQKAEAGKIFIAPGDFHLKIEPSDFSFILDDGAKENFVRPSADPLFRSIADAFGKYSLGAVLTGLGRDGAQGAASIDAVGGKIVAQDPDTAVAPSMPRTIIETGLKAKIANIAEISRYMNETIAALAVNLK